jgi:hypothetical protein
MEDGVSMASQSQKLKRLMQKVNSQNHLSKKLSRTTKNSMPLLPVPKLLPKQSQLMRTHLNYRANKLHPHQSVPVISLLRSMLLQ